MLQMFLQPIVKFTVKRAAISQSLVWAARPQLVILPLLFELSVELDHIFGSKWFINELFHLGYSISYDEVTRFKQNSIISSNFEDILPKYSDSVTQWGLTMSTKTYVPSEAGLSTEMFKLFIKIQFLYMLPLSTSGDLLWHSAEKEYTGNQQ